MKIDRPDDFIIGAMDSFERLIDFVCARDAQVLHAIGFALAHSDPFPLLRALAADLGWTAAKCGDALGAEEIGGTCEAPSAPTLPGPTERVDMSLRFRYRGGVFVVPEGRMRGRHTTMGPHHYSVLGLRVRIVYEHSAAEAEAAQDCAESWRSRMLGAGAMEVECVGEVEK